MMKVIRDKTQLSFNKSIMGVVISVKETPGLVWVKARPTERIITRTKKPGIKISKKSDFTLDNAVDVGICTSTSWKNLFP